MKTFIGTNENALLIQIWTAMIALVLIKWMHFTSKWNWSLANLASLTRMNLFTYRDLREWLDDPFRSPPGETQHDLTYQMAFPFGQPINLKQQPLSQK